MELNLYRMKKFKLLNNESCNEKWEEMQGNDEIRMCEKCSESVHNLSSLSLGEIYQHYFGKGQCVLMEEQQKSFFQKMKLAGFITAIGLTVSFSSQAQHLKFPENNAFEQANKKDSCRIYGKIKSNFRGKRRASGGEIVWVMVDSVVYETKTDQKGYYELILPQGRKIQETSHQELRNLDLDERENHVPVIYSDRIRFRTIGCPAF